VDALSDDHKDSDKNSSTEFLGESGLKKHKKSGISNINSLVKNLLSNKDKIKAEDQN